MMNPLLLRLLFVLAPLLFFMTLFSSCSFSKQACKRLYLEASHEKFDIVIVPGVPFKNGKWDKIMKGRLYWSKYLFDKGIAKNIMYSGSSVYTAYYEAIIMSLYANAIGIPKENIFVETKAEHSTENLYYSYKKARKLGFKNIALASDPFQTKMLRKFARKRLSPDIKMIPFVYDTLRALVPQMQDPIIDPSLAFNSSFISLTKRQGFWKRLRGTLGKNIDKNAY